MIYTKKGDQGYSDLCNGVSDIKKSDIIFEVLGTLDELNSCLGFISLSKNDELKSLILMLQKDLFEMGSLFAGVSSDIKTVYKWDEKIRNMEEKINFYDSKNLPLKNFILPGGCSEACYLHLARAVCRRLERIVVQLQKEKDFKLGFLLVYINRLSDYLFVLARYSNKINNESDIEWKKSLSE